MAKFGQSGVKWTYFAAGFATCAAGCAAAVALRAVMDRRRAKSNAGEEKSDEEQDRLAGFDCAKMPLDDWSCFRELGKTMSNFIADYYANLSTGRPSVCGAANVKPGYLGQMLPQKAPEEAENFRDIMSDVERCIVPGVTHWQHPMFFSYYPANTTPASLLGDMVSGMFNCIAFSWVASPAATELETIVVSRHS